MPAMNAMNKTSINGRSQLMPGISWKLTKWVLPIASNTKNMKIRILPMIRNALNAAFRKAVIL
jgi:hypothetical protein